jgi:hypothetical protein
VGEGYTCRLGTTRTRSATPNVPPYLAWTSSIITVLVTVVGWALWYAKQSVRNSTIDIKQDQILKELRDHLRTYEHAVENARVSHLAYDRVLEAHRLRIRDLEWQVREVRICLKLPVAVNQPDAPPFTG